VGKGTILSSLGSGQYSVQVTPDNSCIQAEQARLTTLANNLDAEIASKELEVAQALLEKEDARLALDIAIAGFAADPPTYTAEQVGQAEVAYREAFLTHDRLTKEAAGLRFQQKSYLTEVARLSTISLPTETKTLWCVDLTEDLTGDVGLLHVNDASDGSAGLLVHPGWGGAAVYSYPRDGVSASNEAVGQATSFLFWALKPCVQRHRPHIRVGTVTAVDTGADTVDITLDAAVSSEQRLNINYSTSLASVPVEYMDCNAQAFAEGDRVIVDFQGSFTTPKVIGFKDNPKPCGYWFLSGYAYGFTTGIPFLVLIGTLKANGEDILSNPTNYRAFCGAVQLTQTRTEPRFVEWEEPFGSGLAFVAVWGDETCPDGPMLEWAFFDTPSYTFALQKLTGGVWVDVVRMTTAPVDISSPPGDPYACVKVTSGGPVVLTDATGIVLYDPDAVDYILINP